MLKNQSNNLKSGDLVRMTYSFKKVLKDNGSGEHVEEFGERIGIVIGICETGGPELDVRWQPSNLRYAYLPENLEKV